MPSNNNKYNTWHATHTHTHTQAVHTLETNDKSQPQTTYVSSASVVTWIWIRDNLNLNLNMDRALDGRMDVVPWMPFDDACRLATLAAKPTPESTPR